VFLYSLPACNAAVLTGSALSRPQPCTTIYVQTGALLGLPVDQATVRLSIAVRAHTTFPACPAATAGRCKQAALYGLVFV